MMKELESAEDFKDLAIAVFIGGNLANLVMLIYNLLTQGLVAETILMPVITEIIILIIVFMFLDMATDKQEEAQEKARESRLDDLETRIEKLERDVY